MVTATGNESNETIPYVKQFAGTSDLAALNLSPLLSAITLPLTNNQTPQTFLILPSKAV